jgi:hypothetical protein
MKYCKTAKYYENKTELFPMNSMHSRYFFPNTRRFAGQYPILFLIYSIYINNLIIVLQSSGGFENLKTYQHIRYNTSVSLFPTIIFNLTDIQQVTVKGKPEYLIPKCTVICDRFIQSVDILKF